MKYKETIYYLKLNLLLLSVDFQNDSAVKKGDKENYSKPISMVKITQDEIINNDLIENVSLDPVTQSLNSIDKNEL